MKFKMLMKKFMIFIKKHVISINSLYYTIVTAKLTQKEGMKFIIFIIVNSKLVVVSVPSADSY
jgi:hypothetical protein